MNDNDPNQYLSSAGRVIVTDGGEEAEDETGSGDGDGAGEEPTLKDIADSIDNATDRMDDIHDTVKSVENTQEDLRDRVDSHEEAIGELREKVAGAEMEKPEEDPEDDPDEGSQKEYATPEEVESIVDERMESAVESGAEKAVAKMAGLDPDDLPDDEEERVKVIRKATVETESPSEDDEGLTDVHKRDETSGEVLMSEDAIEL